MREFIRHTIETAKSAFFLYFAPIKSPIFWFFVCLLTIFLMRSAEAGYLWTDHE